MGSWRVSSVGSGGGTQRGLGSFRPKIVSKFLSSSSNGTLSGRGLDPLLIPVPLQYPVVLLPLAGRRQPRAKLL